MESFFIDASVIADYILVYSLIKEKRLRKPDFIENLKELIQKNPKALYSFLTLYTIHSNKTIMGLDFSTSTFAISEVSSVIHDKYRIAEMERKNIPIKYWCKKGFSITLPDEDKFTLKIDIVRFYLMFIETKRIKLADGVKVEDVMDFIIEKNCETPDSFLLSQAKLSDCDFFVTIDGRLEEKFKNNETKIIKPQSLYEKIKSKAKQDKRIEIPFKGF